MHFNAENIADELWNSTVDVARDGITSIARYVPPLVANGKVYMGTAVGRVAVYGLLSYTLSPTSLAFGNVQTTNASASQAVMLTNIGAAPLTIFGITLSGYFSQTNNCAPSVQPQSVLADQQLRSVRPCGVEPYDKRGIRADFQHIEASKVAVGSRAPQATVTLTGTGVAP